MRSILANEQEIGKSIRTHIIGWNDKILLKDLEEEEFQNVWSKMHWVYNKELNYVEVGEEILEEASY